MCGKYKLRVILITLFAQEGFHRFEGHNRMHGSTDFVCHQTAARSENPQNWTTHHQRLGRARRFVFIPKPLTRLFCRNCILVIHHMPGKHFLGTANLRQ